MVLSDLSRVFSIFGARRGPAFAIPRSEPKEMLPSSACLKDKLFIYVGSMDDDAPLTEIVEDMGTRSTVKAIAAMVPATKPETTSIPAGYAPAPALA